MLRIRAEQYEVFAAAARRRFTALASRHARSHWPEEAGELGEEGLESRIDEVLDRSREVGWTRESDVLRILNLTLALECSAGALLEQPWVVAIQQRTELATDERLARIEREALARLTAPERRSTDSEVPQR